MARRRRRGSFGVLPIIGVLSAPKLIALGAAAYVLLKSRTASAAEPPNDVEAIPQGTIAPSGGGGKGSYSTGPTNTAPFRDYGATMPGPYTGPGPDVYATYVPEAAPSEATAVPVPSGPIVDPYLPPTSTGGGRTEPYAPFVPGRPDRAGASLVPQVPVVTPVRPSVPSRILPVSSLLAPRVTLPTTALRGWPSGW